MVLKYTYCIPDNCGWVQLGGPCGISAIVTTTVQAGTYTIRVSG